jgi:small-conductance mechanosensitive channel
MKLLLVFFKKGLNRYKVRRSVEQGRIDAFYQIIKYIVWIVFFLISPQIMGLQLTWLMAGGAALMVGIGLGLQNVFNDLVSGIIILFEGSVDKGDIITVGEDMIGEVKKINIRTSHIQTRNNLTVIVPNHKLVDENIINWSHSNENPRFILKVGVAYGSPTRVVKDLLLKVVNENKIVDQEPKPFVRFKDFGESSLDFELYFWCDNLLGIEDTLSDIRFCIDDEFRNANITIPFPQRDVHLFKET